MSSSLRQADDLNFSGEFNCYDLICGCEYTVVDDEVFHNKCNSVDCCCATLEQLRLVFAHPNFYVISVEQYWH